MTYGGLTPDVPLGPFEGTPLTAYAAAGKTARLHASLTCTRLRTGTPRELRVPFDAATVARMCTECTSWGRWARSGPALGLFLEEFRGVEMAYHLDFCLSPDPDDPDLTAREIAEAAAVLRRGGPLSDEDGDHDETAWTAYREARDLRDSVVLPAWGLAASSLLEAAGRAARYPWLSSWAAKRLERKAQYAEILRRQAAALISEEALITAATVDREDEADLPVSDPAFAVLGDRAAVRIALSGLRREWRSQVRTGRELPGYYSYLGYDLMGGKRKGRALLDARKNAMLDAWAERLRSDVTPALEAPRKLVLATVPTETDAEDQRWTIDRALGFWDTAVLLAYTQAVDWPSRTFLLSVPTVVAERLLRHWSPLEASECPGDPDDAQSHESILRSAVAAKNGENGTGAYLPGTLDDTPVGQRRIVDLAEVRVLRERLDRANQLFVVCSAVGGVEVLSLARLERRCEDGWSGILLAEAGDLPNAMIAPLIADSDLPEQGAEDTPADDDNGEDRYERWRTGGREPSDPDFGAHLGMDAAAQELQRFHRWPGARRKVDRALRTMALVSGASDLRSIEGEYTDPREQTVPHAVWDSLLLSQARVDLLPFRPEGRRLALSQRPRSATRRPCRHPSLLEERRPADHGQGTRAVLPARPRRDARHQLRPHDAHRGDAVPRRGMVQQVRRVRAAEVLQDPGGLLPRRPQPARGDRKPRSGVAGTWKAPGGPGRYHGTADRGLAMGTFLFWTARPRRRRERGDGDPGSEGEGADRQPLPAGRLT